MAQIKYFGLILVLTYCFNASSAGRMDMDYDTILSLLSEADNLENDSLDIPQDSNSMPKYYTAQSQVSAAVSPTKLYQQQQQTNKNANFEFAITKPSASSVLAPHVEILHIVESFLRLKGEVASRIHALINDNFDLIQSLYNVIVSKATKFHGFTLIGISVIRKILEFAVQMIGTWEVNAPNVSFGVNKFVNAMG